MPPRCSFTLLLPALFLLGCGANPTLPASSATYLNLTGNWEAIGVANVSSGSLLTTPIADFTGALQSSKGNVTGTLRAFDFSNILNPCVTLTQDLPAAGTLSTTGDLVLTVPISGGIATINAQLTPNLQAFATASWQIIGGACAMPTTAAALNQYAPVTGTYTGVLSSYSSPGVTATVTATLTQSSTPDADGRFPLTGTITSQGACVTSLPLGPQVVSGNGILTTFPSFTSVATITGPFPANAATIQSAIEFYSACSPNFFTGILTRQ